jgi:hypothetical protein
MTTAYKFSAEAARLTGSQRAADQHCPDAFACTKPLSSQSMTTTDHAAYEDPSDEQITDHHPPPEQQHLN